MKGSSWIQRNRELSWIQILLCHHGHSNRLQYCGIIVIHHKMYNYVPLNKVNPSVGSMTRHLNNTCSIVGPNPSKHDTLTQCRFNVGPLPPPPRPRRRPNIEPTSGQRIVLAGTTTAAMFSEILYQTLLIHPIINETIMRHLTR